MTAGKPSVRASSWRIRLGLAKQSALKRAKRSRLNSDPVEAMIKGLADSTQVRNRS